MKTWVLLLPMVCVTAGVATAQKPGPAAVDLKVLKGRSIPGFTLKKTTTAGNRVVELWERSADRAQLRIEIVPRADLAATEARVKAFNARIPKDGAAAEELLFRSESSGDIKGWTNYRADHSSTFKTYRFWRLQHGTLVMADVTFTGGKPKLDAAQTAFIAAKRVADGTIRALAGAAGR